MKRYRVFTLVGDWIAQVGPAGGAPIYAENAMCAYMKACQLPTVLTPIHTVKEMKKNERKGE